MKASYITTIGLFLLAGIAAGCDNISEDDRYIKVEKPTVENPRNLLIMEFTGNNCRNCPDGARMVENIKEDEPAGRVISVGLHPDGDINTQPVPCLTPPYTQDFRCEEATVLYKYYSPGGFPCAIFNGAKSSMSSAVTEWQTLASKALAVPAKMSIDAECGYDNETRLLTVDYEVIFGNVVDKKLNAMVWLVENDIIGTQMQPDGKYVYDYVHNHVLRASLNGEWGEEIGNKFDSESRIKKTASMTLKDNWVAKNCDVVVFVFCNDDKEVEQAISVSVNSKESNE